MLDVVDRAACVREFGRWSPSMLKHEDDLARYGRIIRDTRPEVVVECGTYTGQSAAWFAEHDVDVISVDIEPNPDRRPHPRVTYLQGDSASLRTFDEIRTLVGDRRCMVSLDSDHSERHVRLEIAVHRDLVSRGCYLVVEDGVIDWLPVPKPHGCHIYSGSVIDAIADTLPRDRRFVRDTVIESLTPVTMSPVGWWRRV